jgi:hypothetical protein
MRSLKQQQPLILLDKCTGPNLELLIVNPAAEGTDRSLPVSNFSDLELCAAIRAKAWHQLTDLKRSELTTPVWQTNAFSTAANRRRALHGNVFLACAQHRASTPRWRNASRSTVRRAPILAVESRDAFNRIGPASSRPVRRFLPG